jgi:hypothetical protein
VDFRHQREEDFARPAEEAEVEHLILVGLEDVDVGEAAVFLGADVEGAAKLGLAAGGQALDVELRGGGDPVGVVVGLVECGFAELNAAGDEAGG